MTALTWVPPHHSTALTYHHGCLWCVLPLFYTIRWDSEIANQEANGVNFSRLSSLSPFYIPHSGLGSSRLILACNWWRN